MSTLLLDNKQSRLKLQAFAQENIISTRKDYWNGFTLLVEHHIELIQLHFELAFAFLTGDQDSITQSESETNHSVSSIVVVDECDIKT